MIEAYKDTNVQELIFVHGEFLQHAAFGHVLERWVGRSEIEVGNYFVHSRVQKRVGRAIDGVDVLLIVTLKVN